MFNVVFETIGGTHNGVTTWSSFEDEDYFNKWYNNKMKSRNKVVAKGVTFEQAIKICSTPKANMAAMLAVLREAEKNIREVLRDFPA